jgi:cell division protein FtsI (penicillin-binding protein 3)
LAVNKKNIMTRYFFVVLVMGLIGVAIIVKGTVIMFAERQYWQDVADRFVKENVTVKPNRGNILSSDGKFLTGVPHLHGLQSRRSEERHHAYEPPG